MHRYDTVEIVRLSGDANTAKLGEASVLDSI